MNYKEVFSFIEQESEELKDKFSLQTFLKYEPKLEVEFYLQFFIKKLLFEVDILELRDFLEHHYHYCDDPEKYYQVLEYKVVPKIKEIKENGQFDLSGINYPNQIELDLGFVETEGVIKNWNYDYRLMMHQAALFNLQYSFEKKLEIVLAFIEDYKETSQIKPLKWLSGPSQLAVIFRDLIDKEYMTADEVRGEVSNRKLALQLFKLFDIKNCESPKSIEIYLSPNNKRYKNARNKFDENGFEIPPSRFT